MTIRPAVYRSTSDLHEKMEQTNGTNMARRLNCEKTKERGDTGSARMRGGDWEDFGTHPSDPLEHWVTVHCVPRSIFVPLSHPEDHPAGGWTFVNRSDIDLALLVHVEVADAAQSLQLLDLISSQSNWSFSDLRDSETGGGEGRDEKSGSRP
jgi:hypothetical protein